MLPPPSRLSELSLTESLDAIDRAESTAARVQVAATMTGCGAKPSPARPPRILPVSLATFSSSPTM